MAFGQLVSGNQFSIDRPFWQHGDAPFAGCTDWTEPSWLVPLLLDKCSNTSGMRSNALERPFNYVLLSWSWEWQSCVEISLVYREMARAYSLGGTCSSIEVALKRKALTLAACLYVC